MQGDSYTVTSMPLQADVADGAEVIKTFLEDHQKGTIQLDSVFPKVTNEQLAAIPEIDRMLKLRGSRSDDDDPRRGGARRVPRLLEWAAPPRFDHGARRRRLILWPIGVGKSCAIDRIIEAAVGSGRYDLVIALAPTRRVLEERA